VDEARDTSEGDFVYNIGLKFIFGSFLKINHQMGPGDAVVSFACSASHLSPIPYEYV
jgi:hypothetical protein